MPLNKLRPQFNDFNDAFSFAATLSLQGSYKTQTFQSSSRGQDQLAPNLYTSLVPRTNIWTRHNVPPRAQYRNYHSNYNSVIARKIDPLTEKPLDKAKSVAVKSYWTQQPKTKTEGPSKWINGKKRPQVVRDVQRSLKPKASFKKTILSDNPRWARNQGDHKKRKKQFIVANWGGLGLGNGLVLGTPTVSYGANPGTGLGTGYGAGLSTGLTTGYGTGIGTMLAAGYGSDRNGVLDTRHTFGTNYDSSPTSNTQSSAALSDLSAAELNSLTSQAGLNYLSNLDAAGRGGGTTDLNSLTSSISRYQNNDLDVLGNDANTASIGANAGFDGLNSLTGGTAQNQQYAGNSNLENSLEGKLSAAGGSRQGIGGCKF